MQLTLAKVVSVTHHAEPLRASFLSLQVLRLLLLFFY